MIDGQGNTSFYDLDFFYFRSFVCTYNDQRCNNTISADRNQEILFFFSNSFSLSLSFSLSYVHASTFFLFLSLFPSIKSNTHSLNSFIIYFLISCALCKVNNRYLHRGNTSRYTRNFVIEQWVLLYENRPGDRSLEHKFEKNARIILFWFCLRMKHIALCYRIFLTTSFLDIEIRNDSSEFYYYYF